MQTHRWDLHQQILSHMSTARPDGRMLGVWRGAARAWGGRVTCPSYPVLLVPFPGALLAVWHVPSVQQYCPRAQSLSTAVAEHRQSIRSGWVLLRRHGQAWPVPWQGHT